MILKTDGTLWACGRNYYGQLGDGTKTSISTPKQVMNGVAAVSAGFNHTMILKTDGTLWACGYNEYGQLGDRTNVDRRTPVMIGEPEDNSSNVESLMIKREINTSIFTITGQRLTVPRKGINIIGGKKVIVR